MIEHTTGQNAPWFTLTDSQKAAFSDLFPEAYSSPQIAQGVYMAGINAKVVDTPVYALDGMTQIGVVNFYWYRWPLVDEA